MNLNISDDLLKEIHDILCEGHEVLITKEEWEEYMEDILRELHDIQ